MGRLAQLFGLILALAFGQAWADPPCRMALDFGSSGIRAGRSDSPREIRHDADFLTLLARSPEAADPLPVVAQALQEIDRQLSSKHCIRMAGGFSVWRTAASTDAHSLATRLRALHDRLALPLLVIPQPREGHYGYVGTRQRLGQLDSKEVIFDLGGGSFQVASATQAFGRPLGQKIWHATLCEAMRGHPACTLLPLSPVEIATGRTLVRAQLADLTTTLPPPFQLIAVSRPITRSVAPAVYRLTRSDRPGFIALPQLRAAIYRLTDRNIEQTAALTGIPATFADRLLSDMLLLETLIEYSGNASVRVADLELSNVAGLLDDPHAWGWIKHYDCYLDRLEQHGESAFLTDPATCERPDGSS